MSFFKEVDLAIREATDNDQATQDTWLHMANEHFQGRIDFKELPFELQQIIKDIEQMYIEVCENLNKESEVHNEYR